MLRAKQYGLALMVFITALTMGALTFFLYQTNVGSLKFQADNVTTTNLAIAKQALIGYAVQQGSTEAVPSRPGELPCPDTTNDGSADPCTANALGRLPWRTLGINDLRDGRTERLWYAVSTNFKNNPRVFPLNSDTSGTIAVRDQSGQILHNAATGDGAVAVIISAGASIIRSDGFNQNRSLGNQNLPVHYLDNAAGEENQTFINGTNNGFIKGPIKDNLGAIVLNDQLEIITRGELMFKVEQRVLKSVSNAILDYYCGNASNSSYINQRCVDLSAAREFYPSPASFADANCLGILPIAVCNADNSISSGRVPVTLLSGSWEATSIFRGGITNNWFQRNGWREQILYAVSPACIEGTLNCNGGGGLLQVQPSGSNARLAIVLAARSLAGQPRATNLDKQNPSNFYEDENQTIANNLFVSESVGIFNDRLISQ